MGFELDPTLTIDKLGVIAKDLLVSLDMHWSHAENSPVTQTLGSIPT
jgi:hypothetical protein